MANAIKPTGKVKTVLDRLHLSREYTAPYFSDFNVKEELYRCHMEADQFPYRSRVFDPKSFAAIEKIVPRMVANRPRGEFRPREAGDITAVKIVGELFDYDWERARMFLKLVNLVKPTMIFGTGIGRIPWRFERRKIRYSEPLISFRSIQIGKTEKSKMKIVYDGPDFENCNLYDCYPDPQATNFDDARWFLHKTFPTINELEKINDTGSEKASYKNLSQLKELIKEGTGTGDDTYRTKSRSISGASDYTAKDKTLDQFEMVTMYTPERWVSIASKYNLLLRDIPNPYYHGNIPFVKLVDYPLPNEWFGLGEIEPIERLQRGINAVINQRLDNVNQILNTGWKVDTTAGVDLSSLVSRPGMIVKTRRMDGVQRIEVPDVTGSAFADTYTFLQASLVDALGIQDYTVRTGQTTPSGQKTATGLRQMQEEANARFKLKIQIFEDEVIKQIAEQWLQLRQQFTTRPQVLRITGKDAIEHLRNETDFKERAVMTGDGYQPKLQGEDTGHAHLLMEPNDIVGEYDFVPEAGSTQLSDPYADRESFTELIGLLAKLAPAAGIQVAWDKVVEELFEKYGVKGSDRFIEKQGGLNAQIPPGEVPGGGATGTTGAVQGAGYQTWTGSGQPQGVQGLAGNPGLLRAAGVGASQA